MSKRPIVSIRNYESVYEHYSRQEIIPFIAKTGHLLSDMAYWTKENVHTTSSAKERIEHAIHHEATERILFFGNHQSNNDPFVAAAMFRSQEYMNPMISNISIVAKHTLFKHPMLRFLLDGIGAVPAFLSKRTSNEFFSQEEHTAFQRKSAQAMCEVVSSRMRNGHHLVMYAEVGGRNNGETPHTVRPLHVGIGHIACSVGNSGLNVTMIPLAVAYPENKTLRHLHPHIVLGEPLRANDYDNPYNLTEELRPLLQTAVNSAVRYTYS